MVRGPATGSGRALQGPVLYGANVRPLTAERTTMRRLRISRPITALVVIPFLAAAAAVAACTGPSGPTSITGLWGSPCTPGPGECFELQLVQSGDTISGSAGDVTVVSGTYERPNIKLVITMIAGLGDNGFSRAYSGYVAGTTMVLTTPSDTGRLVLTKLSSD